MGGAWFVKDDFPPSATNVARPASFCGLAAQMNCFLPFSRVYSRCPNFASHFAVPKPRFSVELACAAPIFISQPALGTVSIDTSPMLTDVFHACSVAFHHPACPKRLSQALDGLKDDLEQPNTLPGECVGSWGQGLASVNPHFLN